MYNVKIISDSNSLNKKCPIQTSDLIPIYSKASFPQNGLFHPFIKIKVLITLPKKSFMPVFYYISRTPHLTPIFRTKPITIIRLPTSCVQDVFVKH